MASPYTQIQISKARDLIDKLILKVENNIYQDVFIYGDLNRLFSISVKFEEKYKKLNYKIK